jgi:MFS transporter, MHS family, metabolite:H+ symporter
MTVVAQKAPLKPPISSADDPEYAANLRRATLASTAGSALEYYDFALYGLATALIFSKLFFTNLSPATGLIAAFATFGVGFVARPLGGLFFGTVGDRIGRKWVLVATIVLMGGSSTLVGALPTYDTIGVWAPILLVFLRLCQGFGAGAEQAGATVLMAEYSPVKSRGFFAALPFIGIQAGTLLAAGVFAIMGGLPDEVLLGWAWRIPFLASFLLILVALFIRVRLKESPTFIELEAHEQVSEHPMREIFGHSLGSVLRGIGLRMAENGGSYMFNSLAVAYATGTVMVSKSIGPLAVAVASLIGMVSVPLAGWISDRLGRIPVYRFGAVVLLLLAFPGWYLISKGNPVLVIVVIAVAIGFGVNTMLGAQCALLPELFGNKHRYLGVAVSREFSAVIAGGLAGVLGAILIKVFDGSWVPLAIYAFILAAITLGTTFITPETRQRDLTRLPDARDDVRAGVAIER